MKLDLIKSETGFIRKTKTAYIVLKIIPHVSNLNSTARKIQSTLYSLFSQGVERLPWQREKGLSMLNKENLHVDLKDPPSYWWWVKMTGTEDKDSNGELYCKQTIEFYIIIPEDYKSAFTVKFLNHEQWKRATLEEVETGFELPTTPKDMSIYTLGYTRHDMFSLSFDYKDQNVPIHDILSVSRELEEGESLYYLINARTMGRKKWKSLSDYAWEQWEKGHVPSRPGFNPTMLAKDITNLGVRSAYELKGVADDFLDAMRFTFFNDRERTEKAKYKPMSAERAELLVNGDLSTRTKNKRNLPVFKTSICCVVTSTSPVKREMLARSLTTSFTDLFGDNELRLTKSGNVQRDLESLLNFRPLETNLNLMSVEEIGKLVQLPTADLQREFEDALEFNKRIETTVTGELADERGLLAGTVTNRGEVQNIYMQRNNLDMASTSRVILGSPRMGKDQAAINLIVEGRLKHKMGAVILDVINEQNGHRGMGDAIRDHLPEEHVIDLNLLDSKFPVYLGLEPIVKMIKDPRIAADRVAEELCAFLLQDGDLDKLQTADHLREASKLANADLLSIKHIFTSKGYRKKLIAEKQDLFDMDIWDQYEKLSEGKQQAIYTPIMRRLGQIVNSEYLKTIFCQKPNPKMDLFKWMEEGKVIIFRMKSGVMSSRVIEILCYWIVLVCFLIKLAQGGNTDKSNGTYLILNEPHQYLTNSLAHFIERIFAEGPKYRLTPVLIFHNFKQFKKFPGFVDMMKSASLNWHLFRNTNDDVYKELFPYLSRTFESPLHAFEATKRFQYIGIWLDSMGEYHDPFVADSLPLVTDRYKTYNNSHLTQKHSRIYGTPDQIVLDSIKARNREAIRLNDEAEAEEEEAQETKGKKSKKT